MMIYCVTLNFVLESSIFLCNGIRVSRGTLCSVWLEAVNETSMWEKSVVSELQRAVISWPSCSQGVWQPLLSCRPGTFAPLGQWVWPCAGSAAPSPDCWNGGEQAGVVFSSSQWQLRQSSGVGHRLLIWKKANLTFFSTRLPQDFFYYHIFLKAFRIGCGIWAHFWMSGYKVCLAWCKFRVNRQLCFLNMRHRMGLCCQGRQITPQMLFFC